MEGVWFMKLAAPSLPGLVAVEMTVSVLVEIMWSFISQTPGLLGSFLSHFMKLLTSEVSRTRLLATMAEQVMGEKRKKGVDTGKLLPVNANLGICFLAESSDQFSLCQDVHAAPKTPSAVKAEGSAHS